MTYEEKVRWLRRYQDSLRRAAQDQPNRGCDGEKGDYIMKEYLKIPSPLTIETLKKEFGIAAVDFYLARINERITMGKIYRNPLKTIWLWATEDRRTNQGFWTTYRGHTCRRKKYGGS